MAWGKPSTRRAALVRSSAPPKIKGISLAIDFAQVCSSLMSCCRINVTLENVRVLWSFRLQDANQTSFRAR